MMKYIDDVYHKDEQIFCEYHIFVLSKRTSISECKRWARVNNIEFLDKDVSTSRLWIGNMDEKKDVRKEVMEEAIKVKEELEKKYPNEIFRAAITDHIY